MRVLTWHVHGSYLWYLSQVPVTWVLPVRNGHGGRTPGFDWPDNVVEVPADEVRDTDLDLVVTGSSDHHGLGKVDHDLGVNTTDPEQLERLLSLARSFDG